MIWINHGVAWVLGLMLIGVGLTKFGVFDAVVPGASEPHGPFLETTRLWIGIVEIACGAALLSFRARPLAALATVIFLSLLIVTTAILPQPTPANAPNAVALFIVVALPILTITALALNWRRLSIAGGKRKQTPL